MTDKMREEFAKWIKSISDIDVLFDECGLAFAVDKPKTHGDKIVNTAVEHSWSAWRASRAALCVELPKQWFDDGLGCDLMEVNHVADALDAAGVRYK